MCMWTSVVCSLHAQHKDAWVCASWWRVICYSVTQHCSGCLIFREPGAPSLAHQPRAHMNNTCCAACAYPLGGKGLSSNKNVKQMSVKCSRNEFTCEHLRFLFTLMGCLRFPRGVAKVDPKKRKWMLFSFPQLMQLVTLLRLWAVQL